MELFAKFELGTRQLICQGKWHLVNISKIQRQLEHMTWPASGEMTIEGAKLLDMDTAGASLLSSYIKKLSTNRLTVKLQHFSEHHKKLMEMVKKQALPTDAIPQVLPPLFFARVGQNTINLLQETNGYLSFIGQLTLEAMRVFTHVAHLRLKAIISVIDKSGYQALPIIALLSFMIGIVISYQMGNQLRAYGANVFIVDLLGLSVLREFGPLLTAIMVAGRTGSAFTAELGMMKLNQEIDALNTMGVTPAELLLLPRIIGLLIALPLLTIWADIFGVLGGMVMAQSMLDVSWADFLIRFQHTIPLRALLIGLGKAPVFALIIASIGCFQGMEVRGSADDVGKRTTRSVVLAIFFIIIVDAIFSVLFSQFKL